MNKVIVKKVSRISGSVLSVVSAFELFADFRTAVIIFMAAIVLRLFALELDE